MHSSYFVLKSKEGKQAEQLVKDYLTDRSYTVQDVSEEQDNYQNDVDFIVQKDGRTSRIEVKLDTRLAETQNIAFEDVFYLKDKETGQTETREGYYHYSQCDFLIFVSPADRNLYMVHPGDYYRRICPKAWCDSDNRRKTCHAAGIHPPSPVYGQSRTAGNGGCNVPRPEGKEKPISAW